MPTQAPDIRYQNPVDKTTNIKTVTDVSLPCLSACGDNKSKLTIQFIHNVNIQRNVTHNDKYKLELTFIKIFLQ